jgi:8-oxo-dGTP diphosphatase/A/G-specific adenine glycosylase
MNRIDVAIAAVFRQGRLLICRRRDEDPLGGYWELPGGKVEPSESPEACLARELKEELGVAAEVVMKLSVIEHDYPTVHVRLHPFLCTHTHGEPQPLAAQELIWIDPTALRNYRFPPANDALIDELIDACRRLNRSI